MPPKVRQLRAIIRKAGFKRRPGKGSHEVWQHSLLPGDRIVISGKDGDDAQPYQEREVAEALAKLDAAQRREP
jgi:predicted RNA binding protein YcfA (HicA-like mRNA interferase family)